MKFKWASDRAIRYTILKVILDDKNCFKGFG